MIENSHNPNAMKAMLGVGAAPQKKAIEGVQYTPVKSEGVIYFILPSICAHSEQ